MVQRTVPVPRALLIWLTFGTMGGLVFDAVYTIDGALRPGYDPEGGQ